VNRETKIEKGKEAQMFISLPATLPPYCVAGGGLEFEI